MSMMGEAAKAVGVALAILAVNLAVTTLAIVIYAQAIAPGHPAAFYQAAAPGIGAWTAPICGAALFAVAIAALGRRRPERSPWAFALKTWIAYLVLDAVSGAAMGAGATMVSWMMAFSMGLALAGGLAGAALAQRNTSSKEQIA
ncbi:MAG: hypothetical protein E7812_09260 [Phenylobacterium sp.]|nr:MAG: hypothetical protein E7812_09260 [Phenylobacterium sp.]